MRAPQLQKIRPYARPLAAPTAPTVRPQASRKEKSARTQGVLLCVLLTGAALAATAQLSGVRLADLVITCVVQVIVIALALRDSRHLPMAIMTTWVFSRLARRLVDYYTGGYTSLTALSLLPMLATAALLIPLIPRLRYVTPRLRMALAMLSVPVVIAGLVGLVRFGPSAAPEAGGWLLPLLFVPYLATRPMSDPERWAMLRSCVLVCAAGAVYGIYQFLVLPPWDVLWLVESGMTSSMGEPVRLKMRVWGPMSSAGTAGGVWALAIIAGFAERGRTIVRALAVTVLTGALMVSLVRGAWVMAALGVICFILFSRGRDGLKVAFLATIGAIILIFVTPHLPGGERIGDRLQTFTNLEEDQSVTARISITENLIESIAEQPLGAGIGFKSAGKVGGESVGIVAVDNGYADLFLTLGPLGGLAFLGGLLMLARQLKAARTRARRTPGQGNAHLLPPLAMACMVSLAAATVLAFCFAGETAVWLWLTVGLASGVHGFPGPTRSVANRE